MYLIKLEKGTESKVLQECHDLVEAKVFNDNYLNGKRECDEEDEGAFRLATYDVGTDGNLECVDETPFFAE